MREIKDVIDLKDLIDEGLRKSRKLKEVYIKIYWKEIVGEISKKSFPKDLKNGVLLVLCESSTLIHYMSLNKLVYIEKINEIIKEDYVKEIRFLAGSLNESEMKLFGGNDE
ncbi:MAG: DUF721 domain-containing protein [Cetobacterium sp.]